MLNLDIKKLTPYLIAGIIPVIILGALFPNRLFKGNEPELHSVPGAEIVAFVRDGCPHCADFEDFAKQQGWAVEYNEVTNSVAQYKFEALQARVPELNQGVPTIVVNGNVLQGYETDEKTGKTITQLYECQGNCLAFDDFLASDTTTNVISAATGTCTENCDADLDKFVFDIPFIGKVDLTLFSLPALSLILGGIDGFNPCAMWVLITLLTLLITTKDWKKIWIIGGTFLIVSGVMYYLFIAAWLNVFLLVGINAWIQKVIGIVALGGGAFYLYEAFGKDPNQCKVTDFSTRSKIINNMKKVMGISAWPAMILGVAVLAASVNLIELVCTAGLPVIFTQILAFNDVSVAGQYGYLGLYILAYMFDDFVIFAIAIKTMHATGLTTKYRRFTLIFGGMLMYTLGLLLIFATELLSFGH